MMNIFIPIYITYLLILHTYHFSSALPACQNLYNVKYDLSVSIALERVPPIKSLTMKRILFHICSLAFCC